MLIFIASTTLIWFTIFVIAFHLTQTYRLSASLREIFLLTAITLGILIVASTEILSLFGFLTPTTIKIFWLTTFIALAGWVSYLFVCRSESMINFGQDIKSIFIYLKSQPWQFFLIISLIVITFIATLTTIVQNPVPNYGDSMRYHLTRTLLWEQQSSVKHFATHNVHQISLPPFAEFAILQINFLMGDDHLANIVQWTALLICVVAISDIAKQFGADNRQQLISALLCVSIPMALVQATNTMNDLVIAAWLVSFIDFGLKFKRDPKNIFLAAITGLTLGLALFTKSTAFIFALPFSLWVAISVIRTEGFRLSALKAGMVIMLMILLINGRHFAQNTIIFGSPLGDNLGTINEVFSLRMLASNTIRNIQMQMLPSQGNNPEIIKFLGSGIKKLTWNLHNLTGMDPNDPQTTFLGPFTGFEHPGGFFTGEGRAGSIVHLTLIFLTIIISLSRTKRRVTNQFMIVLIVTFLLLSFVLKTQNWVNRLVLPYLIMWTPLIPVTLFLREKRGWLILPVLIWIFSLPWLLNTDSRPLLPNQERRTATWPSNGIEAYFLWRPDLLPIYDEATSIILNSQCSDIGIIYWGETNFFEYPFWMMLRNKGFTGTIKHVMVSNESKIYEDTHFSPCILFSNTILDNLPEYNLSASLDQFWIYSRKLEITK